MTDRRHGMTYRAIAERDGVHCNAVWEAVTKALADVRHEPAAELLNFELAALDELIELTWQAIDSGELEKVEQLRKLRADRRKLLGVDAATRLQVVTETVELDELRKLLNTMGYDIVPLKTERN